LEIEYDFPGFTALVAKPSKKVAAVPVAEQQKAAVAKPEKES
jgi:hypothetical protein